MEDILLDRLFGGERGTFIDIGANHPFQDSNTYFFYLRGWRGVNIEPARDAHALFLKYRPEDLNLNVAVSDHEGELPFFEIKEGEALTGLSTLDAEVAEHHRTHGFNVTEHRVPVRTLAALIDEHRLEPPDLLSIDVEHHEGHVIHGIPLDRWQPRVLVVEATFPLSGTPSQHSWEPILTTHGYIFAATNGINRFYLRSDLAGRLDCFETPVNMLDQCIRHETMYSVHRYEGAEAALTHERFQFEQERGGWAWGKTMAAHAQAMWEQERAEFERLRNVWHGMHQGFELEKAHWQEERARLVATLAGEREAFEAERARFERAREAFEKEREAFHYERAGWERASEHYLTELAKTQRRLRPYRLIDRFGVLERGYAWARGLKKRSAS
jgi:FkbM family methyltransferase